MSKKTNTLLFVLGATVFQVLSTLIILMVLMVIYAKALVPVLPENAAAWGLPVLFIGSLALSFFVYRIILKQIMKRIDLEKYLDPIFGSRKGKKPKLLD